MLNTSKNLKCILEIWNKLVVISSIKLLNSRKRSVQQQDNVQLEFNRNSGEKSNGEQYSDNPQ
jgi:hypothetical protein